MLDNRIKILLDSKKVIAALKGALKTVLGGYLCHQPTNIQADRAPSNLARDANIKVQTK